MAETIYCFELRSIDAWREPGGCWTWNDSFKLEEGICLTEKGMTSRYILKMLRRDGRLTNHSKGRVRVYDDQDGVIEIQDKGTGRPLLALILNNTYKN